MPRLRLRRLPHDRHNNGRPVLIPRAPFARPLQDGRGGLLVEAIRFYNLQLAGVTIKSDWPPFSFLLREEAAMLDAWRLGLHDALYAQMRRALNRGRVKRQLRRSLRQSRTYAGWIANGDLPRLAVKLHLDDGLWRRGAGSGTFKQWGHMHEELDTLRALVAPDAWAAAISASYPVENTAEARQLHIPARRPYEPAAIAPAYGLAEYLYLHAASLPTYRHAFYRTRLPGAAPFTHHQAVREQVQRVERLLLPALGRPYRARRNALAQIENRFIAALSTRSRLYSGPARRLGLAWALALMGTLRAFLADLMLQIMMTAMPLQQVYDKEDGYAAVALWEALTGETAVSPSLPFFLGMGEKWQPQTLNERPPRGPEWPYDVLSRWQPDDFFAAWQAPRFAPEPSGDDPAAPDAGQPQVPPPVLPAPGGPARTYEWDAMQTTAVFEAVQRMAARPAPVVTARQVGSGKRQRLVRELQPVTYDALMAGWRAFPTARPPGLRRKQSAALIHAATLAAQASLYAAGRLLAVAESDLGLPSPYDRDAPQADTGDAVPLEPVGDFSDEAPPKEIAALIKADRPPRPALTMAAANRHWGGRHPPHKTHRDGATYDLDYGANHVPWDALAAQTVAGIKKGIAALKAPGADAWQAPDALLKGSKPSDFLRSGAIYVTHRTFKEREEVRALEEELAARADAFGYENIRSEYVDDLGRQLQGRFLFRRPVKRLVQAVFSEVNELLDETPGALKGGERRYYACLERDILRGLPHFSASLSLQQIQLAHTAILLSGPSQIILGSPLVHLRAISAIREGLGGLEEPALLEAATGLVRACDFVFLPTDHHNHWHVQYHRQGNSAAEPIPAACLDLWLALGVDFQPFIDYVRALKFYHAAGDAYRRERTALLLVLEDYQDHYLDRYGADTDVLAAGPPPEEEPDLLAVYEAQLDRAKAWLAARRRLHALLRLFAAGTPYARPLATRHVRPSKIVKQLLKQSSHVVALAETAYREAAPPGTSPAGTTPGRLDILLEAVVETPETAVTDDDVTVEAVDAGVVKQVRAICRRP